MTEEVEEALARARKHLRSATVEGLEAASALLDAATSATGIDDADPRSFAGEIRRSLDDLRSAALDEGAMRFPAALAEPLISALDAEIKRWEQRSANDPNSRPVLRAFLAVREFLWEMGVRSDPAAASPREASPSGPPFSQDHHGPGRAAHPHETPEAPADRAPRRRTRERVQRFEVE